MYLTQQTDYALRVLMYAGANSENLVNIATISNSYNISKSHLMKVVTALVKGGFLHSVRGKGGGLRLAREAQLISVGAVVRCMEPMILAECFGDKNECMLTPSCRLIHLLEGAKQAFLLHLDGFTLADLLNDPNTRHLLQFHDTSFLIENSAIHGE